VVAGDVCIDWLWIPVEAQSETGSPNNWKLQDGRHMYRVRGGAWLTYDMVEAAVRPPLNVLGPRRPRQPLANVPPNKVVHSMATLTTSKRDGEEGMKVWVVETFDGNA